MPIRFDKAAAIVRNSSTSSVDECVEKRVEFRRDRLPVVASQDVRRRFEDFGDRPVRDALAVREAPPPVHVAALLEPRHEFVQQAALADAGRADDSGNAGATLVQHLGAEA